MLYPLSYQVQNEPEQHDDIDYESLVGDQSESVDDSLKDQPIQQEPMTHSHTKALMKANLLMSEHFGTDNSFCPEATVPPSLTPRYTYIKLKQPTVRPCMFYVGCVCFLRVSNETQFHNFIVLF